MKQMN